MAGNAPQHRTGKIPVRSNRLSTHRESSHHARRSSLSFELRMFSKEITNTVLYSSMHWRTVSMMVALCCFGSDLVFVSATVWFGGGGAAHGLHAVHDVMAEKGSSAVERRGRIARGSYQRGPFSTWAWLYSGLR